MNLLIRSPQPQDAQLSPPGTESQVRQGPPEALLPGPKAHDDHSPNAGVSDHYARILIGVTALLLALCTLAILGRILDIIVRRRTAKQGKQHRAWFRSDDVFSLLAFILFIGLGAMVMTQSLEGLKAGIPDITLMIKAKLANTLLYLFCVLAARVSLLLCYRWMFGLRVRWFRWGWWALLVLATAQCGVFVVMNLLACAPRVVSEMWRHPDNCVLDRLPSIAGGVVTILEDLGIWLLPIGMLCKLRMDRQRQVAVMAIFGLGFVVVAFSTCRAVVIAIPESFPASGILIFILCSSIEPAVMIFCGCLLAMKPLYGTITSNAPTRSMAWSKSPYCSNYWESGSQLSASSTSLEAGMIKFPEKVALDDRSLCGDHYKC